MQKLVHLQAENKRVNSPPAPLFQERGGRGSKTGCQQVIRNHNELLIQVSGYIFVL